MLPSPGALLRGLLSSPMIDLMKGNYYDQRNNCIGKEGCKRISTSSVNSNVGNEGAGPNAADCDCDADRFGPNTEFHVLGMLGANDPLNSINMLKPGQMILFK